MKFDGDENSDDDDDVSETESEWNGTEMDDDDEEDEENEDSLGRQSRSILWLCQEGQIHVARRRLEALIGRGTSDNDAAATLKKEIFQIGHDKNYPLHEILMGGTSDENASAMTLAIMEITSRYPTEQRQMLSATPPSHLRTPLHWAAWGNAKMEILVALVNGNPDALLVRDKKNQGHRTPVEILKRYFGNNPDLTDRDRRKIPYLERAAASWMSYQIGLAVHLAANRYFGTAGQREPSVVLVPFYPRHRRQSGMKPKSWFLLSIIGYLIQREMKPLVLKILSYVGVKTGTKRRSITSSSQPPTRRKRGIASR